MLLNIFIFRFHNFKPHEFLIDNSAVFMKSFKILGMIKLSSIFSSGNSTGKKQLRKSRPAYRPAYKTNASFHFPHYI